MLSHRSTTRAVALAACLGLALPPSLARAQSTPPFDSGSTGADGAFAPATSQTVQLPESGVFHFTTVTIPVGVTIRFARNSRNTPVTILATGDVRIAGTINLRGGDGVGRTGGAGAAGGFDGGAGGIPATGLRNGVAGSGPGGGGGGTTSADGLTASRGGGAGYQVVGRTGSTPNPSVPGGHGGATYGSADLQSLAGGSGGGGSGAASTTAGTGGGGGGGAILIASSGSIIFEGQPASRHVDASGGRGASSGGGGGSGGAIRLVATTITGDSASLAAAVGGGGFGNYGSDGFIRIEAFDYSTLGLTSTSPLNTAFSRPNPVAVAFAPRLRIASIAGAAVPATSLGSLTAAPDLVLPAATANPVTVALEAENVPVDATVAVTVTPASGPPVTVQSTPLAGSLAASTATASVTLPAGACLVSATLAVDLTLPNARTSFVDGEPVARVEVSTAIGGEPAVTYVTRSGRRVRFS